MINTLLLAIKLIKQRIAKNEAVHLLDAVDVNLVNLNRCHFNIRAKNLMPVNYMLV